MKLLDISKCHVDSPDFKADLATLEDATTELEKKIKRICDICKERQEVAERERALTQRLIQEFDFFASHDLDCAGDTENAANSVEMMTTALKQLVDHHERMSEQINIAILRPLQDFMSQDLEHVKTVKKTYHKVRGEATHALEKFSQCKRPEMSLFNELSLQLFDARHELHKTTCNYALELNGLHSQTTPDFLNRIVDFVMSQLSYFHLGHLTIKDSEPHITAIYTLLEKLRRQNIKVGTQDSSRAKNLLDEVWVTRAQNLVRFYQDDLSHDAETARSTVGRHLSKYKSDIPFEEKQLEPPEVKPSLARTKNGYLWYAEHRTFGTTWMRLYFCITKGILVSPDSTTKAKLPISLHLNLCNVKLALPTDTERNFAFKITSPSRVLLLQAEDSRDLQDWMEVLNNAITFAIQGQATSPDREMAPGMLASGDKSTLKSSLNSSGVSSPAGSDGAPVRPPRRRSAHISKELYALPGNTVCADCGSNKPKWASVNLGVLICIECSGIHRSLGVYISQVRSLTLDTLKSEWVARMKEVGNAKSNEEYEEFLPEDFDREALRKKEDWRQEFITDKYVNMKYTSQKNKERILQERQAARSESLIRSGVTSNNSPESLTPSSSAAQLTTVTEQGKPVTTATPNSTSTSLQQDGATLASKNDVTKTQDSSVDASSSQSDQAGEGPAADGSSVFKKMTKSLGTAKDALAKLAKNE